jgi:Mn-dependent DtxR family transcriptional regulator
MNVKHETFEKFLTSVDNELGRDKESLHLFEWVIEDRYESRLIESMDYFAERPDLRSIQNEHILHELKVMEDYFVSKEEFEKCACIVKVRSEINQIIFP